VLRQPLFEFSGACAGCGETPYLKLLTQLFGDRLVIANATGCSSIYGGNLPTTPYTTDANGRGPGVGQLAVRGQRRVRAGHAPGHRRAQRPRPGAARGGGGATAGDELVDGAGRAPATRRGIAAQRQRVATLRRRWRAIRRPRREAKKLARLADYWCRKSVWIVGGDGWAYDIGYGGLDHVLASHRKVNVLVLDTEVYSNTGGQASKATPLGAAAKFADRRQGVAQEGPGPAGDELRPRLRGVERRDAGASAQTVRVLREAERHPGPSLVIAYSPCIAHGYDLVKAPTQQKRAVDSGVWPLYRYDPARVDRGEAPLVLDSGLTSPPRGWGWSCPARSWSRRAR
jgi:pyruvate-ferredoxin/flavodoxin oxidoreductase